MANKTISQLYADNPIAAAGLDANDLIEVEVDGVSGASQLTEVASAFATLASVGTFVAEDFTGLGNLGASETITGVDDHLVRRYGTLDQATCAITISTTADQQIELQLIQDGTGGRATTWVGVDMWTTADGAAPDLSFRSASVVDLFSFEDRNGTCIGTWETESPVVYAVIQVTDMAGTAITVADDIGSRFVVPASLNNYNLVSVFAKVKGVSASGGPLLFQVRNSTQTADMLSTRINIDDGETSTATAATAAVIDTGNDDVATGDSIVFDCDDAGDGAADGLVVILGFRRPS